MSSCPKIVWSDKRDGFKICMAMLDNTRLSSASRLLGWPGHARNILSSMPMSGTVWTDHCQFSNGPGADCRNVCRRRSGQAPRLSGLLRIEISGCETRLRSPVQNILQRRWRSGLPIRPSKFSDLMVFHRNILWRGLSRRKVLPDCGGDIQYPKDDHCKKCVRP